MKELDLHGFDLDQAKIEVLYFIRECVNEGFETFSIIHGYHSGSVLKKYFRSNRFIQDVKKAGVLLKREISDNPGNTSFRIVKK